MKHIVWIFMSIVLLAACGQSYEEQKRLSRLERIRLMKEDSAALKVAVMPTLDCLPMYVAREYNLFDTLGADVRLKYFTAQMDCDTALTGGSVEGSITDVVRGQRMIRRGTPLNYVTATNAYWQLITNRNSRIKELKQLDDKMLAMTRYSATDLLGDYAVDSVKLKSDRVFRIQINDVNLRLLMLLNNEMDAMLLTEPQATEARLNKGKVLMDTRKMNMKFGAIAFRTKAMKDKNRQKQLDVFIKAYNMACDSINKYGAARYRDLIVKYCKVKEVAADTLAKDIRFTHVAPPRQKDIDRADRWLDKQ